MIWQDILISIASVAFTFSLIPQIYLGYKTKKGGIRLQTSIPICLGMLAVSISYATLSLYFSTFFAVLTALFWFILVLQEIRYNKKPTE